MPRLDKADARGILNECGVYRNTAGHWPDFHTLNSDRVEALVDTATERRYRKPKNANGNRGRYFYEYLRRSVSGED